MTIWWLALVFQFELPSQLTFVDCSLYQSWRVLNNSLRNCFMTSLFGLLFMLTAPPPTLPLCLTCMLGADGALICTEALLSAEVALLRAFPPPPLKLLLICVLDGCWRPPDDVALLGSVSSLPSLSPSGGSLRMTFNKLL